MKPSGLNANSLFGIALGDRGSRSAHCRRRSAEGHTRQPSDSSCLLALCTVTLLGVRRSVSEGRCERRGACEETTLRDRAEGCRLVTCSSFDEPRASDARSDLGHGASLSARGLVSVRLSESHLIAINHCTEYGGGETGCSSPRSEKRDW